MKNKIAITLLIMVLVMFGGSMTALAQSKPGPTPDSWSFFDWSKQFY